MALKLYLVLWITAMFSAAIAYSPLKTDYEWKYFDYDWDSPSQKQQFINSGRYDYRNLTPIDVDRSVDGRIFVTIIRTGGVPATLHTISNKRGESGALLKPYPGWSWYNTSSCKGIINVFRVAMDKCNRMWVLDTGSIDSNHVCPAKLLIFNLQNNKLIKTIEIPDKIAQNKSGVGLLITPIIEAYGKKCEDITVYMADVTGYGLVVYNSEKLFRLEGDVFQAEQKYSNITVAGETFYLPDGILGMALSPKRKSGNRYLFFRPLASRSLYAAKTNALKHDYYSGIQTDYTRGVNILPHQASAMVFSSEGILFYGLTTEVALGCWNMNDPFTPEHFKIAIQDSTRLQFISGIKAVDASLFFPELVEELLIMTNRVQKLYKGTMNFTEVNYRLLRGQISDIIKDTPCEIKY